jgi:hypothetical protein
MTFLAERIALPPKNFNPIKRDLRMSSLQLLFSSAEIVKETLKCSILLISVPIHFLTMRIGFFILNTIKGLSHSFYKG